MDRRVFASRGAREFVGAGERETGVHAEGAKNFSVASENVAEAGKRSDGGAVEGHAAGASAGAVAERIGFEDDDGFGWREPGEMSRGGEASETCADDGEVHASGETTFGGAEGDGPRRRAPGMRAAAHWRLDAVESEAVILGEGGGRPEVYLGWAPVEGHILGGCVRRMEVLCFVTCV